MMIQNNTDYELKIIDEKGKEVYTLYNDNDIEMNVDIRRMLDWKIKYPDGKIMHLFDIFNEALSHVDINLKGIPECSYDDGCIFMMNSMPHHIQ